ncbi:hypothetical protein CDAR_445641 [Caerostris darwini]|uniref:Uncharacterized protein n=1 Tax=Caerostris darwini TaxID=1538125 RepID=A0AAV4U7H9_9ARAC|nr:hypothetical protein CDAR_445641 [Caerostris darwini]
MRSAKARSLQSGLLLLRREKARSHGRVIGGNSRSLGNLRLRGGLYWMVTGSRLPITLGKRDLMAVLLSPVYNPHSPD